MKDVKAYTRAPASGSAPKQLVILLHGVGANGQDLIGLAGYFKDVLPDAVFVSPDAPFPCDMVPGMPNSYQWFSLQNRDPDRIRKEVEIAHRLLSSYIDKTLKEYDLKDENLALIGFSQGTMMSLYTGPRRAKPMAGILGYSGALIGGEELAELDNIQKMPIHLFHGELDMVVPFEEYTRAWTLLGAAGFEVTGDSHRNLDHSINEAAIESGGKFLKRIFS